MSAEVVIRCGCCKGSGRVALTGLYLDTFLALAAHADEITGAKLAREMGVNRTAMNNRLAALERFGLAKSRRNGRERLFKASRLSK